MTSMNLLISDNTKKVSQICSAVLMCYLLLACFDWKGCIFEKDSSVQSQTLLGIVNSILLLHLHNACFLKADWEGSML